MARPIVTPRTTALPTAPSTAFVARTIIWGSPSTPSIALSSLASSVAPNSTAYPERTNHTSATYHEYGLGFVVPMCLILSVAMVLAVAGNIMVIMTIVRHKTMRTRTNMFIVSLAVADILVAVCDMPFSIITLIKGDWVFGDAVCEFNGFTMSLFLGASVQTLMLISIHKYISITRPFSRFMTPRRILAMIAVAWIWSITYSIAGAVGWTDNVYKKGASQCGPTYPSNLVQISHSICNTFLNLLIPIAVTFFCYTKIFCEIRSHMSRMRENTNIDMNMSVMQQKRISVTLLVVLICFITCWTPYIIYSCYAAFIKDKTRVPVIANPLAYWCGYINSACNPIIYAFRSPSFRQGYYSLVCGDQPRPFHSGGSLSQRSPSFRRRTLQNSLQAGANGASLPAGTKAGRITCEHKNRTKRLVSMNSWASISFSAPFQRTSEKKATLQRQASVDTEATFRPLLKSSCDSPVSPYPPDVTSNGNPMNPSSPIIGPNGEYAETSLTNLSPILEGSVEDLAPEDKTSCASVESNNERNRLMLKRQVKNAVELPCAIAFANCDRPTTGTEPATEGATSPEGPDDAVAEPPVDADRVREI